MLTRSHIQQNNLVELILAVTRRIVVALGSCVLKIASAIWVNVEQHIDSSLGTKSDWRQSVLFVHVLKKTVIYNFTKIL